MVGRLHRLAMIAAAALAPLTLVTVVSPGVSNAAECGSGTVSIRRPTPAWRHRCHRRRHLRHPRGTVIHAGFSVGICAPIPFVSLCTGI